MVRCLCAAPLLPALVFWLPMLSQLSDCSAFTRVFDNNILHNKSIALVYIYEHERNANIHIYMVMKGLKPFIDHLPLNMIMCILLYRSFLIQSRISTSVSFSSYCEQLSTLTSWQLRGKREIERWGHNAEWREKMLNSYFIAVHQSSQYVVKRDVSAKKAITRNTNQNC